MVRLITDIQQNHLPTVSNSFSPNPLWRTTDSFDYQQYYDKKKGIRTFQQARNKANCKPDENFKLDYDYDEESLIYYKKILNNIYNFHIYKKKYSMNLQ